MTDARPVLRIRNEYELQDLIETAGRDGSLIERDFALTMIAAGLVAEYGDALCFKGGFVLRHVYGHERFSKDIDTTKINPPKSKLDSEHVAITIRESGMRNLLSLNAGTPATDTGRSLDFDNIRYSGPLGGGFVSVEVSYREDLVNEPRLVAVGHPYYEPFEIPVMQLDEIVAEKLRALAQRQRPTDLSDLAMILRDNKIDKRPIPDLVTKKFELVKAGDRQSRIENNILAMGAEYDDAVSAVAPDAPDYATARDLVLCHLPTMLP
jgi:predicted nucleotidyltransferase component of viral defense system